MFRFCGGRFSFVLSIVRAIETNFGKMADRFKRYPFVPMGAGDSGSSHEEWTAQDIERFVCLLLSDSPAEAPVVSPGHKTITDFLVEDKINYFQKVYSNIMVTKNSFLEFYNQTNDCIERMIREIMLRAQNRGEELKAQLLQIRRNKIDKWNTQMTICEGILNDLRRLDGSISFPEDSAVDQVLQNYRVSELEFVDSGEMKIDTESYSKILEIIETLGTINCGSTSGALKLGCIVPKFSFGSAGMEAGQFCRPWGVCSDETGRILVCDRSNHRIQIFNECGHFLIQFGKEGSKPGEFSRPSGIAVDKKCRIIVADKDNHRIQVFTYSGHYLFSFGKQGTRAGQFNYPWDVAVNKKYDIAVSDSKNHRIQLFSESGTFLRLFDARTTGIENPRAGLRFLDSPRGLAFRPDDSLLVTDFNNHRILLINRQFNGVTTFGSEGHDLGQFFRPQGIACDSNGRFAVADCKNYRIQVFDVNGTFQQSFGRHGSGPGQFDCPQGISFHPNQNIIVVDFNNNRVQILIYPYVAVDGEDIINE